jgi:hypothetical protein
MSPLDNTADIGVKVAVLLLGDLRALAKALLRGIWFGTVTHG